MEKETRRGVGQFDCTIPLHLLINKSQFKKLLGNLGVSNGLMKLDAAVLSTSGSISAALFVVFKYQRDDSLSCLWNR